MTQRPLPADLGSAVAALYAQLGTGTVTLGEVQSRLRDFGCKKDLSQLSRYRSGKSIPDLEFLVALHEAAFLGSGGRVAVSWEHLRDLLQQAGRGRREVAPAAPPVGTNCADRQHVGEVGGADGSRGGCADVLSSAASDAESIAERGRRGGEVDVLLLVTAIAEKASAVYAASCISELYARDLGELAGELSMVFARIQPPAAILRLVHALHLRGLQAAVSAALEAALEGGVRHEGEGVF